MLKTENLKLTNDLKAVFNSDIKKKKKVCEKEIIDKKIAQEASNYATRFVPQSKGLWYDNASSSKGVSYNVPIQQDHACKETEGTSDVHLDKNMQNLYNKLQNMKRKEIDFAKQKNKKPFIPAYSKYINVSDCKIC